MTFEEKKKSFFRWLENNRGIIVLFIVLPLSLVFSALTKFRQWILRNLYSAPQKHDERVAKIQAQVGFVKLNVIKNFIFEADHFS